MQSYATNLGFFNYLIPSATNTFEDFFLLRSSTDVCLMRTRVCVCVHPTSKSRSVDIALLTGRFVNVSKPARCLPPQIRWVRERQQTCVCILLCWQKRRPSYAYRLRKAGGKEEERPVWFLRHYWDGWMGIFFQERFCAPTTADLPAKTCLETC